MERTNKTREIKAKAEAETVEKARVWDEAKEKWKAEIDRVDVEAREWSGSEAKARVREKANAVQR